MAQLKSNNVPVFVHAAGICESTHVGEGTRIWAFAHVLPGAHIGHNCNVCDGVFIENDVIIGDFVTIKSGVQLWDGVRLGHRVFIGPNATFTNDLFPRSKKYPSSFAKTVVEDGASVGANATILPGVRIGYGAMIGAGAVVVNDVPARATVVGNPARVVGYAGTDEDENVASVQSSPEGSGVRLIQLQSHRDGRGRLIAAETLGLPFVPNRLFLVDHVASGAARGAHSHRLCHQLLVAVAGAMKAVIDDGKRARVVVMNTPEVGLYLPPMIWSMQFDHTDGAVLLVMASHPYDRSDYVTDYAEFIRLTQQDGQQGNVT
jgi:UDP-2-acetamido-3-amino-2,3-dideoxy-glucuronate N-acetyltransferase